MTPEMRKKLEEMARKECALEEYPNSLWQRQGFMMGAQAYESLLAEMAGQDVEKAAEAYRKSVEKRIMMGTLPVADVFIAGDAHGYARAKAELERIKTKSYMKDKKNGRKDS